MSHSHASLTEYGLNEFGLLDRRSLLKVVAAGTAVAAVGPEIFSPSEANAAAWHERLGTLKVGYLPITDSAPLLVAHGNGYFEKNQIKVAQPTLFRSWPSIAEAFAAKQVDVVHLLMPLALQLRFEAKQDVRVISWNHTDGSALTVAKDINSVAELAGKTIAVPFWYSIHNVILQQLLRKEGLKVALSGEASAANKTVKLVVLPPSEMPPALAAKTIAGYVVAEPFNALAEVNGIGKILRFTGDVWRDHACCVTVVRGDLVRSNPLAAQAIVDSIAQAQLWLNKNRATASDVLKNYLPQAPAAITKALTGYSKADYPNAIQNESWKSQRITFQPFPYASYTTELIKQLRLTRVDDDNLWLNKINLKTAHSEFVASGLAERAINKLGGRRQFGLSSLTRKETIKP